MDLPDCPPGAEGYEDSVVEVPKKPGPEEAECTKAEKEFQDHLNSLKIKVEDGGARCMVDRRGRDISGKWIYLCYPCAAVCSGESILQTHISGKKHKTKLSMKTVWPQSIFDEHPYVLSEKGLPKEKDKDGGAEAEKVLKKMAEEVSLYNKPASAFDEKYNKYRNVRCHIQDTLDNIKTPLVGVEYLVEHPPEQPHHEPRYICTLCVKQGHPRTIINHMTCFWHRYNYLTRHFTAATSLLSEYRAQPKYREGVTMVINRLTQRIEEKYGRLKPVNIDLDEYERDTDQIHQWICKSYHFSEKDGPSFEEVVDTDLIKTLGEGKRFDSRDKRDPSPPVVAAPTKPLFNNYTRPAGRQERRQSVDGLSDISDEPDPRRRDTHVRPNAAYRFEPYHKEPVERTHRYTNKSKASAEKNSDKQKPANYEYKQKLAMGQRLQVEEAAKKTLAYHEKNPEKHPLYPEEWKKFWNRRYKEIQSEGKDPSKHDFKPEWIVYWTARMKQLHEEEVRLIVSEIYRKLCLPPPDEAKPEPEPERRREEPRRQPEPRRRIGRSPDPRRRSPPRRSPPRRRSPDLRRRSPPRHSPPRRSPPRRSPPRRSPPRHSPPRRSPPRHSPPRRRSPPRRSPPRDQFRWRKDDDRTRRDYRSPGSRGPEPLRHERHRSRSPVHSRTRSPPRTHIEIESVRRSRSPLSRRDDPAPLRNRSPRPAPPPLAPSLQTVLISDDELRPDDGLSPWNSDNDSLGSLPEARSPRGSRAGSEMSRASRPRRDHAPLARPAHPADLGPPENIVATLRLLVALEDYLGSLGPKIVDLLTEALKMEKEKANSSEELLEREASVALVETAKEKLKGAVQAGLVPPAAAPAVRAAVVRAAATLHAADTRQPQHKPQKPAGGAAAVPVAGVGEVDRAQIAQQMAAALIAQGKTDVSSEELAQLVDAVVGMAEAKKKEAEVKRKVEARAAERASRPPPPPPAHGKTASALQMLQSAYDENEKRIEKEDAPDAMDGLSDSDLETLLKNFNELSAEEQHSLIAYLKKLEAREPQRVEKLRQYVSAADDAPAPASASAPAPAQSTAPAPVAPVTIDSDDDDYTVEEVFQSATQKVKEDQIRQEMEIVKKSLEESKAAPAPAPAAKPDAARGTSAASDLFALVQASLQSVSGASSTAPIDVVTSHTAPRSFGDAPEPAPAPAQPPALTQAPAHPLMAFLAAHTQQQQQPDAPQPVWTPRGDEPPPAAANPPSFDQDTRGSYDQQSNGQDRGPYGTDSRDGFGQDTRGPLLQDGRGPFAPDNRGPPPQRPFDQDGRGPFNQDGGRPYGQDNRGNFAPDGGRPPLLPNAPGMGMQGGRYPMQNNRGPLLPDNRGPPMQDNRGPPMQDNRGPHMQDNRGYNMPDNRSGPGFNNYGQDNNQYNRGNNFMNGRQDMGQDQQQQPQHQYQQKNFRGRGGRGNFGGHMRGRGRGNYY